MEIRGPKGGYGFDAKAQYRRDVWCEFDAAASVALDQARVLILPGPEGLEIEHAVACGVAEHNIVAIDENPAVLAAARWRKAFPAVTVYGGRFSRVAERMKADGWRFDIVNLDFCGALSNDLFSELETVTKVVGPRSVIGLTMIKGRESKAVNALACRLVPREWPQDWPYRLSVALSASAIPGYKEPLAWGEYRSGGGSKVRMLWGVVKIWDYYSIAFEVRKMAEPYDGEAFRVCRLTGLIDVSCHMWSRERWERLQQARSEALGGLVKKVAKPAHVWADGLVPRPVLNPEIFGGVHACANDEPKWKRFHGFCKRERTIRKKERKKESPDTRAMRRRDILRLVPRKWDAR